MSQPETGAVQTVGPVTFDYRWWQARYPELAEWVSPGMGQGYFDLATLYLDNSDGAPSGAPSIFIPGIGLMGFPGMYCSGSPVRDIGQRQILFGLLTAHIAALNAPLNGRASPALIGRMSSASEGSVSMSVEYPLVLGIGWLSLSKYGEMYWAATARYRMARYYPSPNAAAMNGYYGFYGGRGRF